VYYCSDGPVQLAVRPEALAAKLVSSRESYPGDMSSVPVSSTADPLSGLINPVCISKRGSQRDFGVAKRAAPRWRGRGNKWEG
jgi:hypothetical protein